MSQKKMMMVDDEPENLLLFQDLLEAHNIPNVVVNSGEKAIESFSDAIGLIVTDMDMKTKHANPPRYLDGQDFIAILQEDYEKKDKAFPPFYFLTAMEHMDERKEIAHNLGAEGILDKPVSLFSLMKIHDYHLTDKHVVLIGDKDYLLELETALMLDKYKTESAETGESGYDLIGDQTKAVIASVDLKEGKLKGADLASKLSSNPYQPKIILVSDGNYDSIHELANEKRAFAAWDKAMRKSELTEHIDKALGYSRNF